MLTQKMELKVVGKSRYSFDDDKGRLLKGAKIFVEASPVNEADKVGIFQTELALSKYEDFDLFAQVPGSYEVQMIMQAGKGGAKFVVESAKLIK